MEIIPYHTNWPRYTYIDEYNMGEVNEISLTIAKLFYQRVKDILPTIKNEPELFRLYFRTLDEYSKEKEDENTPEQKELLLQGINNFDEVLVALASEKGLKLLKIYRDIIPSIYDPPRLLGIKGIIWRGNLE
jgi:hypothetical protein